MSWATSPLIKRGQNYSLPISLRADRKSTIITTNLSFDRWEEIFGDAVMTAAMIDRLTHKSYLLNMNGSSYRLKETREWLAKQEVQDDLN